MRCQTDLLPAMARQMIQKKQKVVAKKKQPAGLLQAVCYG
jgi:hypothetical protein